jgi:hypothetical protein
MVSTAIATELTTAIRDFSTGVDTRGRALGSSVRHLIGSAGVGEFAPNRMARQLYASPGQLLGRVMGTLGAPMSPLGSTVGDAQPVTAPSTEEFGIVDRALTRC